ncbi:hypothetical protein GC425_05360 [Corynebacterium sp. zg254]|uniref:Uncharacterized protein n=1 Tax=Corynebacterium zhongnanshanii TaxID=2768834 RepID=A0ABQ6VEA9_9CORY|nr:MULTISPECIES: hypothetical protein [Corynebacterium]KAB3522658.1 hypothetical protein F8377_00250 [Corynebacterium zhongnanshanii]MCR5914294.1 hypothetical protein [Corynebacterium sp. zg254]
MIKDNTLTQFFTKLAISVALSFVVYLCLHFLGVQDGVSGGISASVAGFSFVFLLHMPPQRGAPNK